MDPMRPKTLLIAMLLIVGLVGAGAAVAQGPRRDASDPDAAQDPSPAKARHAALAEARHAALASFHENRTRILEAYHATLAAIRQSFLENKTLALETCTNAGNGTADKPCVRDALKPLIEQARADIAAAREDAKAQLLEARQASLTGFGKARADADRRYGSPHRDDPGS